MLQLTISFSIFTQFVMINVVAFELFELGIYFAGSDTRGQLSFQSVFICYLVFFIKRTRTWPWFRTRQTYRLKTKTRPVTCIRGHKGQNSTGTRCRGFLVWCLLNITETKNFVCRQLR